MSRCLKRSFDLLVAGGGLLVLSPVVGFVAVAIRLSSPGPAFFRQQRVGQHGRTFRIHKFRTMRVGVPGTLVSTADDERITPLGGLLRRTKLDELPQLLDVVAGHMSLVGPRPEVPRYVALWSPQDRDVILSVRPGITDPASVEFRNEAQELSRADDPEAYYVQSLLPTKAAMYVEYVRTQCFLGDLQILVRTLRAVVRG